MNIISTHDTERAITALAGNPLKNDRAWQAKQKLDKQQRQKGIALLKLASAIQYTLPGVPCIYYGDETALEGYKDPFCRATYPWGREQTELISWYQNLAKIRSSCSALKSGEFIPVVQKNNVLAYVRKDKNSQIFCVFNAQNAKKNIILPQEFDLKPTLGESITEPKNLTLQPLTCALIKTRGKAP
jgi:glycosidase